MSRPPSPTLRRRRLGGELRRLREAAGLTGDQVVERLGWASSSKVSRIENGRSRPDPDDVARLLDAYGVKGRRREQLMAIARDANNRGWLRAYPVMTPRQRNYAELEAGCSDIREYGQLVVPGLLQAPSYARWRILGAQALDCDVPGSTGAPDPSGRDAAPQQPTRPDGGDGSPPEPVAAARPMSAPPTPRHRGDVDTEVAARTARQGLLLREVDPPRYDAVLEEAAFTPRAGPPDVLADQLDHLCRLADLDHVTLRVLPADAVVGDWYMPATSFSIYQFTDPEDPGTVAIEEAFGHDLVLADDTALTQYLRIFDCLREAARSPGGSRRWLADAAAAARREADTYRPATWREAPASGRTSPSVPGGDPAGRPVCPPAQRGPRRRRVEPHA